MTGDLDDPLLGRTLGGRFRVDRALRRGGMGAVYRGHDLQGRVDVAIKVVKQTLADDPEAIARFKRETRLMAEMQDPHIVRALDAGDADGVLWIAMELLDGVSLRERLDSRGRWPWADTLPVIRQIAEALGAAHRREIIHRDLKPENIMLVDDGPGRVAVKLLDFGVAKQSRAPDAAATHMTGTGLLVGTPGYIAPEVVLEGTVDDPRSDFYALGVTWFEMLTGQKPFSAKTPMALALRHAHELPPTPSSLLPFAPVPGPVEQLVMTLLEKAPERRPEDAAALILAVDALRDAAEQANTPVSTIKDLSPSESTVTSLETPGTHVAPLALTPSSSATAIGPSSTAVTPAPGLAIVTPPSPRALTSRQGIAAGLALVVVVAVGALWVIGGREGGRRLTPGQRSVGADLQTHAAPAPIVALGVSPAAEQAGGRMNVGSGEAPKAMPAADDAPPAAATPPQPSVDVPPERRRPGPTRAELRQQRRQERRQDEAPAPRACTVKGTGERWQVHDGMGWRDLPAELTLPAGLQQLRFQQGAELRTTTVNVPATGRCTIAWTGR